MTVHTPMWSETNEDILVTCRASIDPMVVELARRLAASIDAHSDDSKALEKAEKELEKAEAEMFVAGFNGDDTIDLAIRSLSLELQETQDELEAAQDKLDGVADKIKDFAASLG